MAGTELELGTLPTSVEEFRALTARLSRTPEGTAGLFVAAALLIERDRALGRECMLELLGPQYLAGPGKPNPSARSLMDRFSANQRIARSYVKGTRHDQDYELPAEPFRIATTRNAYSEMAADRIKVFVDSSGADSPRPIQLLKTASGSWVVAEASSLSTGVRGS